MSTTEPTMLAVLVGYMYWPQYWEDNTLVDVFLLDGFASDSYRRARILRQRSSLPQCRPRFRWPRALTGNNSKSRISSHNGRQCREYKHPLLPSDLRAPPIPLPCCSRHIPIFSTLHLESYPPSPTPSACSYGTDPLLWPLDPAPLACPPVHSPLVRTFPHVLLIPATSSSSSSSSSSHP